MAQESFNQHHFEESKLISLLKEDSEYAFQLIYDKHRNRIYKTAIKFLKSPIIAQDVVQDVFLKLWFERKAINESKPLEAWLYTVAKNIILNKLRKIANDWKAIDNITYTQSNSVNNTDYKLLDSEYMKHLKFALCQLSDQQRMAFTLSREDKLTYIEIGQKMGISPLTVKTHLSRAIFTVKQHLASNGILYGLLFLQIFSFRVLHLV
jgi:RNA polymerase sigma-70 factor (ECF subfamily)